MNLYEITKEYRDAINTVDEDGVITEEALEIIDKMGDSLNEKLENIAKFIKELENNIDGIDKEVERLKDYKAKKSRTIERLKNYAVSWLQAVNKKSIETELFKISVRKSESVNILDLQDIDESFIVTKVKETKQADKKKIKEALKKWVDIKGAEIVENQSLNIK